MDARELALILRIEASSNQKLYWGIKEALTKWHRGEGTRNADEVAVRQTRLCLLLGEDGDSLEEAGERVGVSRPTAFRDVATIRRVTEQQRAALGLPGGRPLVEVELEVRRREMDLYARPEGPGRGLRETGCGNSQGDRDDF